MLSLRMHQEIMLSAGTAPLPGKRGVGGAGTTPLLGKGGVGGGSFAGSAPTARVRR